jgi:arylsulfatase A-like enzyme
MSMRAKYQFGCLTRRKRVRGGDVWRFRYYETNIDGGRCRRSCLIGTVWESGEASHKVKEYDLAARRLLDTGITQRTIDFMRRNAAAGKPFYIYAGITQVHFPALPSPAFQGRTGNGDFADAVVEMDSHVGQILDAIKDAHIEQNTVVIFCSDNGPEYRRPWRGTAGYWRGTYHTAMEGSLRAPFIIR